MSSSFEVNEAPSRDSPGRRLSSFLHRHPRLRLGLLLAPPLSWLLLAYLGSLAVLFVAAFWRLDPFTAVVIRDYSFSNFETLWNSPVYRDIALRTIAIAAAVTLIDVLLAFPIAFYMAKVASPRMKGLLVVAILMPLWASYLVKIYAWRIILQGNGPLNWLLEPLGLTGPGFGNVAGVIVFSYLWLPYMILPLYGFLDRIQPNLLEAGRDLGGSPRSTFLRVTLPLSRPAILAGLVIVSLPMFGDYFTNTMLSGSPSTTMIGNLIDDSINSTGQGPEAAVFILILMIMLLIPIWYYLRSTARAAEAR